VAKVHKVSILRD